MASLQAGVVAFKLYPAGATTNSDSGVTDWRKCLPTLKAMAEVGAWLRAPHPAPGMLHTAWLHARPWQALSSRMRTAARYRRCLCGCLAAACACALRMPLSLVASCLSHS